MFSFCFAKHIHSGIDLDQKRKQSFRCPFASNPAAFAKLKEGHKAQNQRYIYGFLITVLFFALSGCSSEKSPTNKGAQIYVIPLGIDYNADFQSARSFGQDLPLDKGGSFLSQTLFQKGVWHRVQIRFPDDQSESYLDVGIAPAGIQSVALYSEQSPEGWMLLEGKSLPDRYIGPIHPIHGNAILYIRTVISVPMKLRLRLAGREEASSPREEAVPFVSAFIAIFAILLFQMIYFFSATRDRIYLYLTGVLLGHAGYFFYYTGSLRLLPVDIPPFAFLFYLATLYFIFLNLAFIKLFHLQQRLSQIDKILRYFNYGYFILMAVYILFASEHIVTIVYFFVTIANSIALIIASILTMRKGSRFEQILCLIFVVMQIHSVFTAIYRSGIMGLLSISPSADTVIYNYGEGASVFVYILFIGGIFLGSISARFGKNYSQLEIMEDEFRKLPAKVKEERKRLAFDSKSRSVQLAPEEIEQLNLQLNRILTVDRIYRDSELDLSKLAEMLQIKPWKLSLFINEHLNTNFRDLIAEHRIQEVKGALLSDQEKSVSRIALDAGFESSSAFYRVFLKHTGMTPTEFREKGKDQP